MIDLRQYRLEFTPEAADLFTDAIRVLVRHSHRTRGNVRISPSAPFARRVLEQERAPAVGFVPAARKLVTYGVVGDEGDVFQRFPLSVIHQGLGTQLSPPAIARWTQEPFLLGYGFAERMRSGSRAGGQSALLPEPPIAAAIGFPSAVFPSRSLQNPGIGNRAEPCRAKMHAWAAAPTYMHMMNDLGSTGFAPPSGGSSHGDADEAALKFILR